MNSFFLWVPPILFAITFHEFSHGYVANRLGDPTARLAGRLTLNPMAHLDIMGTFMLLFFHFGWAKPVPVDPRYLQNPKRDMIWIALAGPGSNLLLALIAGIIIRLGGIHPNGIVAGSMAGSIQLMIFYFVQINLILAVFNMIPIAPLDGSKVLMGLLPAEQAFKFSQMERYGFVILLGVILLGPYLGIPILSYVLFPPVRLFTYLFTGFYL